VRTVPFTDAKSTTSAYKEHSVSNCERLIFVIIEVTSRTYSIFHETRLSKKAVRLVAK